VYNTPLVCKLAAELGVNLAAVTGTGVGGWVRKQDVLDAARAASRPVTKPTPLPDFFFAGPLCQIPLPSRAPTDTQKAWANQQDRFLSDRLYRHTGLAARRPGETWPTEPTGMPHSDQAQIDDRIVGLPGSGLRPVPRYDPHTFLPHGPLGPGEISDSPPPSGPTRPMV
jgi:hypothetical protein